jgi:hypothetical protein
MRLKVEPCRRVPRKAEPLLAQPRKEARYSAVQVECSAQGKGQALLLCCDPEDSGNGAMLAVVATLRMNAYIGSETEEVFEEWTNNGQPKSVESRIQGSISEEGELHQRLPQQPAHDIESG